MSADGLISAAAGLLAEAGQLLPLTDAAQVELFRDEGQPVAGAVRAARKAGRPAGAPNKRTAKVREYLLSRYPHPLVVLAEAYARPVEVLAAELGCSKHEAFAYQLRAAEIVAPYIEGKMPVSIDLVARSDLTLVIPGINAPVGSAEDIAALIEIDGLEALQNQGVEP